MRIHKELHGGSVILKFVVVTFNSSTVLQTSFQTSHFLKQLQLPGSFQCGPSMWRRRTTVTGLVCIVWDLFQLHAWLSIDVFQSLESTALPNHLWFCPGTEAAGNMLLVARSFLAYSL